MIRDGSAYSIDPIFASLDIIIYITLIDSTIIAHPVTIRRKRSIDASRVKLCIIRL